MCGVFGFVSHGAKLNLDTLANVAKVTMRRGPHAWGMAWIDGKGRLKMFKQTGQIVDDLGLLAMASDARLLIGHCRFATHGDPENNLNNHPHPADGGWIVHNGVIGNYVSMIERFDLNPNTECDSELLGLLIEQGAGRVAERCVEAVLAVEASPLVMLGLWKPGRMVAIRQGNPLSTGMLPKATYIGSLQDGLPGKVRQVKENSVMEFTTEKATIGQFVAD